MIMRKNHDLFFALIGQNVRGRLLAYFLARGARGSYVAQAAAALRVHPSGALRELRRLERMGLLQSASSGYRKYYRLQGEHPAVAILKRLWAVSR
jgi:predicted transcriptional regulator